MPTIGQDDATLVAGEDWHILGEQLDRDGKPLDLTDALIAWTLLDSSGGQVKASATITVLDPPTRGIANIELTAATTAAIAPGLYTEALRITRAGSTSELQGLSIIFVPANPFVH